MRRIIATSLLFTLAACGYKGPLYLPKPTTTGAGKAPVAVTPSPASTPSATPTADKDKQ